MPPKVICFGLGRTGTSSLLAALEHLGFGPCYTMKKILIRHDPEEFNTWYNIGQGVATIDDLKTLLKDFNSVVDIPAAIYFKELYEAYPDAKFILTTRDPAKWEASMKATILEANDRIKKNPPVEPFLVAMDKWLTVELYKRYHQDRIYTDTQGELLRHNQRVKEAIPAEKLLVYEVTQGWGPLIEHLGVEAPDIPFPHVMDTAEFQNFVFPLLSGA